MSWRKGTIKRRIWQRVRLQVLERDGYRCVTCGRAGRLEVDHIIPLDKSGPKYAPGNLQTLCRPCHFLKSGRERIAANETPEQARCRALIDAKLNDVV